MDKEAEIIEKAREAYPDGSPKYTTEELLEELLSYRKPKEKPRLLSDEERANIVQDIYWGRPNERPTVMKAAYEIAQAQLDICIKHYEGE